MKIDSSSDEDGFEEGGFEIKPFEEKNVPVILIKEDQISVQDNKPKRINKANLQLAKSSSFEPTYEQTPWDRYGDKNRFTLIYKRYDFVQQDQLINFTCLFQPQFTIQELFKRKKKVMFDSAFESGNLCAVYQQKERLIYDVLMHNDSNTKGYNQWFNFLIRQIKQRKFTIRIVNFLKPKSHFQNGMVPVVCSNQTHDTQPTGVEVQNVTYYKNDLLRLWRSKEGQMQSGNFYTLQFDLQIPSGLNEIYISMNYAYPFSRLQKLLLSIPFPLQNIASTPLGYNLGYINITNVSPKSVQKRKIFIQARQHPGETVSSFMMEGIIKFLCGNSIEAKWLKDQVEFIIVPMVNIDGVQMGNFRCNSTGHDLNRIWHKPDKSQHPEISKLKMMLMKMTDLDFFIDLHGHSKKMNTFLYGCRNEQDPIGCRVYPMIMELLSKYFRFKDCTFSINKWKTKTARATVFNNLPQEQFRNVFTIETSYFGYEKEGKNIQYTVADLHKIGEEIIKGIFVYYGGDQIHPSPEYEKINVQQIRKQLEQKGEEFQKIDLQKTDVSDSGSDSDADADLLDDSEREQIYQTDQSQNINKKYSKSVSQPAQPRTLNRTSHNNRFKQREERINSIVSPKHLITFDPLNRREQPTKDPKEAKDYFVRRQTHTDRTQVQNQPINNDQKDNVDIITQIQKQISKTPNHIQVAMSQSQNNNNCDQISPTALISKQYFKLNGYKELKTLENGQFPALNQLKLIKPQHKSVIQNQKAMETFDIDKKDVLQIPNLQKFVQIEKEAQPSQHYLFESKLDRGMRKSTDSTSKTLIQKNKITQRQNQASQQDDPLISQLIRGIWAMNQQKYGQQLQQPKSIRYYQKAYEDEEKMFDDKKLHEHSRRIIHKKSGGKDNEFYS